VTGAGQRPLATLGCLVVAGIVLAALALQPPRPRGADAPAAAFSAARAFPDIQAIAQRPHPSGSAEAAKVRAYLMGRMAALGLDPQMTAGPYPTLVGILPGADPGQPAVVLMAHADSVRRGPGAADDSAGVASALEIVRALKAAGPHRRDVMVVITDAEEAGLRGAEAFFASEPLAVRAGPILNLEARGDRGRVVMFETHREAGEMIRMLVEQGALHGASSLMPDLYRRLPNNTDLTVALRAGHEGLNYAFFAGQSAYHTAEDTPQNLQQGSVQHMGDQVLAAASVLADAPVLPPRAPDLVYSDIMGGPVLAYPPVIGWLILAASAGLGLLAARRGMRGGEVDARRIAQGAAVFALIGAALAVSLTAAGMEMMATTGSARAQFHHLLLAYPYVLGGGVVLSAGLSLLILAIAGRGWGRWRPLGGEALGLGALSVVWLLAALLQALAPFDAFLLSWPALAIALAAFAGRLPGPALLRRGLAVIVALGGLSQVAYWAGLMFALMGVGMPAILALFGAMAVALTAPWTSAAASARDRSGVVVGLGCCLVGVGLLIAAAN
jgi:hypothetical protein